MQVRRGIMSKCNMNLDKNEENGRRKVERQERDGLEE